MSPRSLLLATALCIVKSRASGNEELGTKRYLYNTLLLKNAGALVLPVPHCSLNKQNHQQQPQEPRGARARASKWDLIVLPLCAVLSLMRPCSDVLRWPAAASAVSSSRSVEVAFNNSLRLAFSCLAQLQFLLLGQGLQRLHSRPGTATAMARKSVKKRRPGSIIQKGRKSFRVQLPPGFSLGAAVCSYGFAMLAPNRWQPPHSSNTDARRRGTLHRPLWLGNGATVRTAIRQSSARILEVSTSKKLTGTDVSVLHQQVTVLGLLQGSQTSHHHKTLAFA